MENIIKNIHRLKDILSDEQIIDMEASALSYRRFARIYFKILQIDQVKKELFVKVWQEKNPHGNQLEKKDLNERAKTLMSRYLSDYTIHTNPIPYQEAPPEIVTPQWIQTQMNKHKIGNKQLVQNLGIAKAEISALINGHVDMSMRTKAMFYYYFEFQKLKK